MSNPNSRFSVKKITIIAMLSTVAFVVMYFLRIPGIGGFLTYEPKDVIITIGGFMMGPLVAAIMSVIVAFAEMLTISVDGPVGMLMTVLAGCSFSCTASFIYRKKHNMKGAIIGLAAGVVAMTIIMLLWNYVITPIYYNMDRQLVVDMIIPILLPFNLLKAGLNSALVMLLYKPIVTALRKSSLLPPSTGGKAGKFNLGSILIAAVLLSTCVLLILVMAGII